MFWAGGHNFHRERELAKPEIWWKFNNTFREVMMAVEWDLRRVILRLSKDCHTNLSYTGEFYFIEELWSWFESFLGE